MKYQDSANIDAGVTLPKPYRLWTCFGTVFLIHLVLACFYVEVIGLEMISSREGDLWNHYWQMVPSDLLLSKPLESIWNLHGQPPLFNMYGYMFMRMFGHNYIQYMHYTNIIMGALLSGMIYVVLVWLTRSNIAAFFIAALLALNPALFVFEAYPLYTMHTAFLLTASSFCLACYMWKRSSGYIIAFLVSLNLLVMTRSMYHLLILFVGIAIACIIAEQKWKKVLVTAILISIFSIGCYGKNYVKFGFFGTSSWLGSNLWHIAEKGYSDQELSDFAENGIIQRAVIDQRPFGYPSDFVQYGFNETSHIEMLARDNIHNINFVAISNMFGDNAIKLILHDPLHYVYNVRKAYERYTRPSTQYNKKEVQANAKKIKTHALISSQVFQGQALGRLIGLDSIGPFYFFGVPACIAFYFIVAVRSCGLHAKKWISLIRTDPVTIFILILTTYTTIVGCLFEYGENDRFKFTVEQLSWALMISIIYRLLTKRSAFIKPAQ
jgi:hypothetical protein